MTPSNNTQSDEPYNTFIKHALSAGFTDDQVNFLWYWFEFLQDEIKDTNNPDTV